MRDLVDLEVELQKAIQIVAPLSGTPLAPVALQSRFHDFQTKAFQQLVTVGIYPNSRYKVCGCRNVDTPQLSLRLRRR